jgi:hypothetical protein
MFAPAIALTLFFTSEAMADVPPCTPPTSVAPGTSFTCGYPDMPLYNQIDPNLAHIQVPSDTLALEVTHNTEINIVDNPDDAAFYNTWLPWGPQKNDPGSIGKSYSITCGQTAMAMAYQAALHYRSVTEINPGSWTDVYFEGAQRPATQAPIATPLVKTNYPGAVQMGVTGLQRLVNTYHKTNTDPLQGTAQHFLSFDWLVDDLTPAALSAVWSTDSAMPGSTSSISIWNGLMQWLLDHGWTGIFHRAYYTVHVTPTVTGDSVTFTKGDESHYLALDAYTISSDASGNVTQTITYNNPDEGIQDTHAFVDILAGTYSRTVGGIITMSVTRTIELPDSDGALMAWPAPVSGGYPTLTSIWDLQDGEKIAMVNEMSAIYVQ